MSEEQTQRDRRLIDDEHRNFVRSSLMCIEKKLTAMNNDLLVVKTTLDNDHPRELARNIEELRLEVRENKSSGKFLHSKIAGITVVISSLVAFLAKYITNHS